MIKIKLVNSFKWNNICDCYSNKTSNHITPGKKNLMLIKVANYAIEDLLQDFKLNFRLLNEIIYVTATVISLVTITIITEIEKKKFENI